MTALRWLLALPGALVSAALAFAIGLVLLYFFNQQAGAFIRPLAILFAVYAFISVGATIVPRYHQAAAFLLTNFAVSLAAIYATSFVLGLHTQQPGSSAIDVFGPLVGVERVDNNGNPLPVMAAGFGRWDYLLMTLFSLLGVVGGLYYVHTELEPESVEPAHKSARNVVLRWVLFLPAALLVAAAAGLVMLSAGFFVPPIFVAMFSQPVMASVFVLVAALIAPSHRRAVGICMVTLVVLFNIVDYFVTPQGYTRMPMWVFWTLGILQITGAILGLLAALSVDRSVPERAVAT